MSNTNIGVDIRNLLLLVVILRVSPRTKVIQMRRAAIPLGLLISLLTFFASKGFCQQDYYVWVDEKGVTNYAERAPVEYKPTHVTETQRFGYKVKQEIKNVEQRSEGALKDTVNRALDPDQAIAKEKAKYEIELAAQRKQNCDLAKKNLARLETFARIKVPKEDGEYRYLSPKEIREKKEESREAILFNCP